MKWPLLTTCLTALLFIASCTSGGDSADQATKRQMTPEDTAVARVSRVTDSTASGQLGFNNGEKWPVNPEMMVHVAVSDSLLNHFTHGSGKSHTALATELEDKKNHLISSCTMKGPAHDALHLWLMPYIGRVENLAKAETEADIKRAIDDLKKSMETFKTYFQATTA